MSVSGIIQLLIIFRVSSAARLAEEFSRQEAAFVLLKRHTQYGGARFSV